MSRRRRETLPVHGREQELGEQPPRLVLRFALVTAVCLGGAAIGILGLTRHVNTVAAERSAAKQAALATQSILPRLVRPSDLRQPVGERRRERLDSSVGRALLQQGTLVVSLVRRDGLVTYSTDHREIGRRIGDASRAASALRGIVTSTVTRVADPAHPADTLKALDAYAPMAVDGYGDAVAVVSIDYGEVGAAASSSFYPIAGILELVLILLYVLLVPLLSRVSRRLRQQMTRIRHQAYHDELTGLPNRLYFREYGEQMLARDEGRVAVLIVDLDRFKEVNDTLGHPAGDSLLRAVAARLGNAFGETAVVARLGGDEFGLLAAVDGPADAAELGARVNEVLHGDFELRGTPIGIEASVGVALFPEDGDSVDVLMQRADVAMYTAKERRAGSTLYADVPQRADAFQIGLLGELRRALEQHEIVLAYQAKAEIPSRRIVGVEALVRWQHPERGLLQPGDFLAYAERTSLNRVLTRYVLEAALADLRRWHERGIDLVAGVNITMFDLLDVGFAAQVERLLRESGMPAEKVELEITESEIMSDVARVKSTLQHLRDVGVRLAIDDFGSGYSSLGYLKTLPVDTLKIDKSFVLGMESDERDRAIVQTAVELGHTLGLSVVAEGVESLESLCQLASIGCDVAQGYYIGRPESPESLAERVLADAANAASAQRLRVVS
jgi:diguanylate cyclase (GGDEF)-like protein